MRILNFVISPLLGLIFAGLLSACSLIGVPDSALVSNTPTPIETTGVKDVLPLFVPQADAIINSVNADLLSPSDGLIFPGSNGFTWLANNPRAALINQEEVFFLTASQSGENAQSTSTEVTQTISSTLPSMLIASGDADTIAWVSDGFTVNALDVMSKTGDPVTIQADSPITGLALSSDGDMVAYGTFDGRTVVQEIGNSSKTRSWSLHTWLANFSFSQDSRHLAGVDLANFSIYLINVTTGEVIQEIDWSNSVTSALYGVHLSPDWQFVAWVGQNVVQIMTLEDGTTGPTLVHQDVVRAVAWSPDDRLLASGTAAITDDGMKPVVMIWDVISGELLNTLIQQSAVQSLAFSPDGRQLAVLDTNGNLQTWSIRP
jgi:WD40 repeat protein